ncbi:hypothetical protein MJ588_02070 [Klebsiella pneumoniae]|nr:hypothetical protein MJ588_02070 [Klebsiella pneumoniae]
MLIMFGMGVHLKLEDFKRVLSRPAPVAAGIFLHYLVMLLAAWPLALLFHMPPELSAGMVPVGGVASGTASNVMIFLAKRDVALSVTISSVSTLVGVAVTIAAHPSAMPDAHIQVDVMGMLPVAFCRLWSFPSRWDRLVHHLPPKVVKAVEPNLLAFSMVCILAIISAVAVGSAAHIASVGLVVIIAVIPCITLLVCLAGTGADVCLVLMNPPAVRWRSRWGCRTPARRPRWVKFTLARWRRCQARCSPSGHNPVRPAAGRVNYRGQESFIAKKADKR